MTQSLRLKADFCLFLDCLVVRFRLAPIACEPHVSHGRHSIPHCAVTRRQLTGSPHFHPLPSEQRLCERRRGKGLLQPHIPYLLEKVRRGAVVADLGKTRTCLTS